jgi:predicted phosphodiesterase
MRKTWIVLVTLFFVTNSYAAVRFAVASDMQWAGGENYFHNDYFKGVCEAIKQHNVDFMIVPGDFTTPSEINWTITQVFGNDFLWYPVIGNHEIEISTYLETAKSLIRKLPDLNPGPSGSEAIYSYDIENVHFSCLNLYYNGYSDRGRGTDADVCDALYEWLEQDLTNTNKPIKLVFGHEPAFPKPDKDCGRIRHAGVCLDEYPAHRDRFWELLKSHDVVAYVCGHTHGHSAIKVDGVWQIEVGHSQGKNDTRAPSTFMIVEVKNNQVHFNVYRDTHDGVYDYDDIIYQWQVGTGTDVTPPLPPVNIRVSSF